MHSTKILHSDETCSLPGNCCLHMLQIRKCTWQIKCCGEALKTQDFRRICNTAPQDCLPSSSDIPLRVSKAVLLCHLTPTTSISLNFRLQIHLNVVKMGKREKKKRWDEITATYGYSRETPLNSKNRAAGKGKTTLQLAVITPVCFPQPLLLCSVTFFSPFTGRLVLLIQTSEQLRQPFVATLREKEMRKKRDGAKQRGVGGAGCWGGENGKAVPEQCRRKDGSK